MTPFAESLEILRSDRGLTQAQLAEKADITSNYLSMLERGVKRPPSDETLEKLSKALELSPDEARAFTYDAELTQFRFTIPATATRDECEMVRSLYKHLGTLTTKQVQLIELALSITSGIKKMVGESRMKT